MKRGCRYSGSIERAPARCAMRTRPRADDGTWRRTAFLPHVDTWIVPRRLRSQSLASGVTSTVVSAYAETAAATAVATRSEVTSYSPRGRRPPCVRPWWVPASCVRAWAVRSSSWRAGQERGLAQQVHLACHGLLQVPAQVRIGGIGIER